MERIEHQEKLSITEQQIKEFLGWYKRFSGKGKTADLGPGETKTIFTSYEKDGEKCINAKNVLMSATRTYNPEKNTISVLHDDTNTLGRTLSNDGQLDKKTLERSLTWFRICVPTRQQIIKQRIGNVFNSKK